MNLRAVGTAHRRWPDRYVPYLRHGSSLTRGHVFRYVVPTGRFSSGFALIAVLLYGYAVCGLIAKFAANSKNNAGNNSN